MIKMVIFIFITLFFVVLVGMIDSEIKLNHCKMELEQVNRELRIERSKVSSLEEDVNYYRQICEDRAKTIDELYQAMHGYDLQRK